MTQAIVPIDFQGVSIIIPAYNEEQAITKVVNDITEICTAESLEFEIIVVDDGSTDGTSQILQDKPVQVIRHRENRGYGASIKSGVLSARFPWVLITDADGTYPVTEIPKLLGNIDHYDMIVGARTGKEVNIPLIRRPAKWMLRKFAQWMAQTPIPDLNSGFRLIRKSTFIRFANIYPDGFSLTTTITLAMLKNNHAVKWVPIDYYKRQGSSKIRPFADTYNFFLLVLRTGLYFDPLRVFFPPALVLLLLGILVSAWEIYKFRNITTVATIILFAGFQMFILGLLADLIVKSRR